MGHRVPAALCPVSHRVPAAVSAMAHREPAALSVYWNSECQLQSRSNRLTRCLVKNATHLIDLEVNFVSYMINYYRPTPPLCFTTIWISSCFYDELLERCLWQSATNSGERPARRFLDSERQAWRWRASSGRHIRVHKRSFFSTRPTISRSKLNKISNCSVATTWLN